MNDQCTHKDICFQFTLGGEAFEAVGFLEAGEDSVQGTVALSRTDNGHLLKSEEDWRFVYEHRYELPRELWVYWSVTARPDPDDPHRVFSLFHDFYDGDRWYYGWYDLDHRWNRNNLVLRRRVNPASFVYEPGSNDDDYNPWPRVRILQDCPDQATLEAILGSHLSPKYCTVRIECPMSNCMSDCTFRIKFPIKAGTVITCFDLLPRSDNITE